MGSYALLMLLSLWLNRRDKTMLLLTLVVSGGIFVHIPQDGFYLWCIAAEIAILLSALKIRTIGSESIAWLSIVLIVWHILGIITDGHRPESPYKLLVRFTEHAELIMLIILSNPILKYKKESHV